MQPTPLSLFNKPLRPLQPRPAHLRNFKPLQLLFSHQIPDHPMQLTDGADEVAKSDSRGGVDCELFVLISQLCSRYRISQTALLFPPEMTNWTTRGRRSGNPDQGELVEREWERTESFTHMTNRPCEVGHHDIRHLLLLHLFCTLLLINHGNPRRSRTASPSRLPSGCVLTACGHSPRADPSEGESRTPHGMLALLVVEKPLK